MSWGESFVRRFSLASLVAVAAVIATSASPAGAAVTIGQTGTLPGSCTPDEAYVQKTVASGPGYSPSVSGVITSWSAAGDSDPNQTMVLMVLRPDSATQFTSVGNDIVRTLTPNTLNTFTGLRLPIEPSQRIAVYLPAGSDASCEFPTGNPADDPGYSIPFGVGLPPIGVPFDYSGSDIGYRVNAQAVVEPTNTFTLGKAKLNKKKGTATVTATVPNPGELTGSGGGAKVAAGAVTSKTVTAGQAKLVIRAKGKKKTTLNETGKVTVKPKITYTPTSGALSTQSIKVKLKKNL
jgi:hypothetical protein